MKEKRNPPSFQEYASDMLANGKFRAMTLQERGLLHTLRMELWIKNEMPSEAEELAKVLRYEPDEIKEALPAVMFFLEVDEHGFLLCEEVLRQHAIYDRTTEAKSEGGKLGRAKQLSATKPKNPRPRANRGHTPGIPRANPGHTPGTLSRDELSRVELNRNEKIKTSAVKATTSESAHATCDARHDGADDDDGTSWT